MKSGLIPFHTYLVGGGGGTPLLTILQPGVLDPLKLVPAIFLSDYPELMMNFIVCLHLAVFAFGGWFLALSLGAPTWAALVAALSLGFSGSMTTGSGNWEMNYLPFTFLPWVMAGIVRLTEAQSAKQVLIAHLVLGWAGLSVFFSGSPTAAYYGIPAVICALMYKGSSNLGWKQIIWRLLPQAILLGIFAGPLIWGAAEVYRYYGRGTYTAGWVELSVPAGAYLGLFIPGTSSLWAHVGTEAFFTNHLMFCGIVPAWYVAASLFMKPRLFTKREALVTAAALALLVPVLSPYAFGLSKFFSQTGLFSMFKWPFRGLPAFQLLLIFLFLIAATSLNFPRSGFGKIMIVTVCLGAALYSVANEFRLAAPGNDQISWFVTNRYYEDADSWENPVLEKLKTAGYVMTLSRTETRGAWFEKPRLFFNGNLGAQFNVPTVHRYLFGGQSRAYQELGMHFSGQTQKLDRR